MGVPWLVANDLLTTLRMPTPARNTSVPCFSGNRLWIPELLLRFTVTTVKLGELVGLHRDDLQQRRRHHHSAAMATGTEKSGGKGFSSRPDEDDARDGGLRMFSLRRLVRPR